MVKQNFIKKINKLFQDNRSNNLIITNESDNKETNKDVEIKINTNINY